MKILILVLTLCFLSTSFANSLPNWEPKEKLSYVYLTWEHEDPSNHITVNYHSSLDYDVAQILYSSRPRFGVVSDYESRAYGETNKLDGLKRAFHNVTITNLQPDQTYYFVVGDMKTGFSKEYKFKTLPADDSQIRFVTGGDMGTRDSLVDMLKVAAKTNPHFVAIGGDISYANALLKNYDRWDKWLKMWTENMITDTHHLIPLVLAVGNHEVNIFARGNENKAPFFFALFKQRPDLRSYFYKKIGDHTIIYFLDTGHLSYYGNRQIAWMRKTMAKFKNIRNQFAVYHIPLYPSHRSYNNPQSVLGRASWIKTFDKYKIDLAFENHDHTLKVTYPLKGNKIVDHGEGRIYLGDGCWGKSPRKADPSRWYLKTAQEEVHVWHVTASNTNYSYEAINEKDQIVYSGQE